MHPVLFQIGSVTIYSYGFFVSAAMALSFIIAEWRAERMGLTHGMVMDLVFLLFITGVAGARLFYVLQYFPDYREHLWRAWNIREGGLVWYGGFLAAAACGAGFAFIRRWPASTLCDFFAPILPLAHAIGRLGCFFNGCCYGRFTTRTWGVLFPYETTPRIPIQLWESGFLLLLSAFLFYFSARRKHSGEIFALYLFFYGALRFTAEFFRGDQTRMAYLTLPQWTSLVLVAGGTFLFFFVRKKAR